MSSKYINKLRLPYLVKRWPSRVILAIFVFINGLITIAILSLLAVITGNLFVFPSLGPTAILFFMSPSSVAVQPRNVLVGHAIGIVCGYLSLVVTGLASAEAITDIGITWPRVIAASLALATTGGLMSFFRTPHAPAGATTLIIALGFITDIVSLVIIEIAVLLLIGQAMAINWLSGAKTVASDDF